MAKVTANTTNLLATKLMKDPTLMRYVGLRSTKMYPGVSVVAGERKASLAELLCCTRNAKMRPRKMAKIRVRGTVRAAMLRKMVVYLPFILTPLGAGFVLPMVPRVNKRCVAVGYVALIDRQ